MKKAGIGGFFMHARGGLTTEYLGEKWFEATEACIDEAKKQGTDAWCYDENGWPERIRGHEAARRSGELGALRDVRKRRVHSMNPRWRSI